jgi:hypothetical protein
VLPPISTFFEGFLANCVYLLGAVLIKLLAKPFGNLTLSPSMSAPASCHLFSASELFTKLTPISSNIASAFISIISNASSFKILKGSI